MAKLIYIFLIPWWLFAYASQAQAYAKLSADSTLEVFSKQGKKGVRNENGNILLKAEYEAFGWSDNTSESVNKYIGYKKNGRWGLMSSDLQGISNPKYSSLLPFQDDLFIVSENNPFSKVLFYGLIKANGKAKIRPSFRNLYPAGNHLIAATRKEENISFGIINSAGKIAVPFEYFHIAYLGYHNFVLTKDSGHKQLIKLEAKSEILSENMDSVSSFRDGVAIIFKNGKQGLIRQDGKILLPVEYKKIEWNNGKEIYVTPLDEWTVLNKQGHTIDTQKADSIFYLNDSLLVKNTSSFAQIHNVFNQEEKGVFHADIIGLLGNNFILNKAGQTFLAQESSKIISNKFSGESNWNRDFFVAEKKTYDGTEYIIISTKGKTIAAESYRFSPHSIALKIKSNWGVFDRDLNEIIPPLYKEIEANGKQFLVNFKGLYGVIDKENNWVIPPEYREITPINATHYKMVDKYLREFISDGSTKYEARLYYDIYGHFLVEQDLNHTFRLVDEQGHAISRFRKGVYSSHGSSGIVFRNDNQHILLNEDGEELFRINDYDTVILSDHDYLAIKKNNQWGFINKNGLLRIANRYDTVRSFQNGRSAIKIRDRWGFIDRNEDLVIQPYYSQVSDFEDQTAFVQVNAKYGVIDLNGTFIIEAEYDEIRKEKSFYLLRRGSKWGIATSTGEIISYPSYDKIFIGNNFIKVEKFGSSRILSQAGKTIIENQFDHIYFDRNVNYFLAKKKAKREQVFLTDILSGKYP
jgi:hypothetical protein